MLINSIILLDAIYLKISVKDLRTVKISTSGVTAYPPTAKLLKVESIVKSRIFLTLPDTLQERLVIAYPKIAKEAWGFIETILLDNKRTKIVDLKDELRMLQLVT
jgi:hypothetical protein